MARCWAVKNDAAPSSRAAKISASSGPGGQLDEQLLGVGLELGVALDATSWPRSVPALATLLVPRRRGGRQRQQLAHLHPLGAGAR